MLTHGTEVFRVWLRWFGQLEHKSVDNWEHVGLQKCGGGFEMCEHAGAGMHGENV